MDRNRNFLKAYDSNNSYLDIDLIKDDVDFINKLCKTKKEYILC